MKIFLLLLCGCLCRRLRFDDVKLHGCFAKNVTLKSTFNSVKVGRIELRLDGGELRLKGISPKKYGAICYRRGKLFAHHKLVRDRIPTDDSDEWIFYMGEHPETISSSPAIDSAFQGAISFNIRSATYKALREYTRSDWLQVGLASITIILFIIGMMYIFNNLLSIPETYVPLAEQIEVSSTATLTCKNDCIDMESSYIYLSQRDILGENRIVRIPIECRKLWDLEYVRKVGSDFIRTYRDRSLHDGAILDARYPDVEISQLDAQAFNTLKTKYNAPLSMSYHDQ